MKLPLVGAILLALSSPAFAQFANPECPTTDEAMTVMAARDFTVHGVLPFQDGHAVFYEVGGDVFAAPIDDNGCVAPVAVFVPEFDPPTQV